MTSFVFGKGQKWADVKADETTFDRMDLGNTAPDPQTRLFGSSGVAIV